MRNGGVTIGQARQNDGTFYGVIIRYRTFEIILPTQNDPIFIRLVTANEL